MLDVLRKLAGYGSITIEAKHRVWKLGVLVRLPGDVQTGFVCCYEPKLYPGLIKLLELAKAEDEKLWTMQRAPKQGEIFDYGQGSEDQVD